MYFHFQELAAERRVYLGLDAIGIDASGTTKAIPAVPITKRPKRKLANDYLDWEDIAPEWEEHFKNPNMGEL